MQTISRQDAISMFGARYTTALSEGMKEFIGKSFYINPVWEYTSYDDALVKMYEDMSNFTPKIRSSLDFAERTMKYDICKFVMKMTNGKIGRGYVNAVRDSVNERLDRYIQNHLPHWDDIELVPDELQCPTILQTGTRVYVLSTDWFVENRGIRVSEHEITSYYATDYRTDDVIDNITYTAEFTDDQRPFAFDVSKSRDFVDGRLDTGTIGRMIYLNYDDLLVDVKKFVTKVKPLITKAESLYKKPKVVKESVRLRSGVNVILYTDSTWTYDFSVTGMPAPNLKKKSAKKKRLSQSGTAVGNSFYSGTTDNEPQPTIDLLLPTAILTLAVPGPRKVDRVSGLSKVEVDAGSTKWGYGQFPQQHP